MVTDVRTDTSILDVIDRSPLGSLQTCVLVLCALVALLDGFDAQAIAFVASSIALAFHMNVSGFGPVFGAGTLGLALGALLLPPLADRFGRKRLLVACVALFAVFSLASASAGSFGGLLILRLLTGLGVGAAVPVLVPLVSEYSPRRVRAGIITLVSCAWPLGAVLGGLVSSRMIPVWGWQSVFLLGGFLPLLLAGAMWLWLPESIGFLVARSSDQRRPMELLRRIEPALAADTRLSLPEERPAGFAPRHLFTNGRTAMTLLLWIPFFMSFLVLFFIFNWLPTVMQQAGLSPQRAILATVLFNLGGVIGTVLFGRLMDRFGQFTVVGTAYAIAAVLVASIGFAGGAPSLLMVIIFLAGFFAISVQACGNALAASLYPTTIRATGVGWAYGIGRIGSIVGPVLGGAFLLSRWPVSNIFLAAALPLVIAALAIPLLRAASMRSGEVTPAVAAVTV